MRRVTNKRFSSKLTYQSLNGALPTRKYSIKAPVKCKISVYDLTEICLQCSKRLVSKYSYLIFVSNFTGKKKYFFVFCSYHHKVPYDPPELTLSEKTYGLVKPEPFEMPERQVSAVCLLFY